MGAPGVAAFPVSESLLTEAAPWCPVIRRLLGEDAKLLFTVAVVSLPGACVQPVHRDGYPIPGENETHCLTVFVPLIGVNQENSLGSTQFWPGSHKGDFYDLNALSATFAPEYSVGSAFMFDYMTFHRGLPNLGSVARPM